MTTTYNPQDFYYVETGEEYRQTNITKENIYWVDQAIKENGKVVFPDNRKLPLNIKFEPVYTPMEMLKMGIFGNAYFGSCKDDTTYPLGKKRKELLPPDWFDDYVFEEQGKPKNKENYFGKKSGMDREWWLDRKLIADCDPLGQFEWFCWYFIGRRFKHNKEDLRQFIRWNDFYTRQGAMLAKNPSYKGLQQALLHWSCPTDPDHYIDRDKGKQIYTRTNNW